MINFSDMKKIGTALVLLIVTTVVYAQKTIKFPSQDGIKITADIYEVDINNPYILLLHQDKSSRGEFKDIAKRLLKLNYNCLAIDMRSGEEANYVYNETNSQARARGLNLDYLSSEQDVLAAVEFLDRKSQKKMVIIGSSFSASLALKVAKDDDRIAAVAAFTPGEYFGAQLNMEKYLDGMSKKTFVACATTEKKYVEKVLSKVDKSKLTFFAPASGGDHGAKALTKATPEDSEYWLQLFTFLQKLRKEAWVN